MYEKSIKYDRATRDFALYLNDDLVGFAASYHEGEIILDRLVFELLSDAQPADAQKESAA
jgi:hypothetical protein